MARQEIVLMKTLNYFIKDENNTVLEDSHSSILLHYAPSLFSQKHSSVSDLSTYFSKSFSFLEHSITFFQPSGNALHLFTYVPDLWQCYITFPALSGNVTPRFRSLAMLHNVSSSIWQCYTTFQISGNVT